jgi:cytochrome b pre-mRNA-processing protein 3
MAFWPFKRGAVDIQAENLLATVVEASRQPALYGEGRVPDTLEGRFELMTLHGVLALVRLRAEPGARRLAQQFVDKLFKHFDAGLREASVGDLTVPKRMRRLASDFYGRLDAYAAPLAAGDMAVLEQALTRNLLRDAPGADAAPLARYTADLSARLAGAPVESIGAGTAWGLHSV